MSDLPRVRPKSRKAWRTWLETHHTSSAGTWLVYAKRHSGLPSLTYNDAVEEALCFGWIDSKIHPIDDDFYMQMFTPRKPKSAWSTLNKARVKRLLADGLMCAAAHPPHPTQAAGGRPARQPQPRASPEEGAARHAPVPRGAGRSVSKRSRGRGRHRKRR